ncbi:MAG TPA: O-antigen ligase family protein [Candidatus Acidoferrales bacterium]|nr:O-antigen ligase family protein [Candidatus Acidoferrales bacterium]
MTIRRKIIDDTFTLAVLFLATGAFQSFLVDPADPKSATDGSTFLQLVWFVVYVCVVFRLIPHYRQVIALVRANRCLFLLVLLAVFSIVWSQDPSLTLRRGVALLATTLIGIDFAIRYSVRDQLRLLCIVLGLVVSLGIVAQLFFPSLIPTSDFDVEAWHGVVAFKGNFAKIVVLANAAVLCRARRSLMDYLLVAVLTLVALALIVAAHSAEALVITVAMLVLFGTSGALRWKPKLLTLATIAGLVMAIPASYVALHNLDSLTAMVGRDATFTGRRTIWPLALSSIARSPIHGYGYSAFWEASSSQAERIREEVKWTAPHAHNGYIDLTLELGLAGLLLFGGASIIAVRRAIQVVRTNLGHEAMWPLMYLALTFFYQFTESSIVVGNTIFWILFVTVSFALARMNSTYEMGPALEIQYIRTDSSLPGHAHV